MIAVDRLALKETFPLPDTVCGYGDRSEFERCRPESGQWVFWQDRVQLVLEGRYSEVLPLHVELSPTYLCNFSCPWCSCRSAREEWADEDVFSHPRATSQTVMGADRLDRVLAHLAEHQIGIQWVGGEPTMHPGLYPAVSRANELGLQQCLFTNGSLLNKRHIDTLLEARLVFVRVSLDAATAEVHQRHHGYRSDRPYAEQVRRYLGDFLRRRNETESATLVGVSLVVDEENLSDLEPTARFIASLGAAAGGRPVDYVIVRPTHQFYAAQVNLRGDTRARLLDLVAKGAVVRRILEAEGVKVVAPPASFSEPEERMVRSDSGDACLSCGWFSEITPSGEMVLCSDRYGNPSYFVGNLADNTIDQIWHSEQRRSVLEFAEATRCFKKHCPSNGRGLHLNLVFHQIEWYRAQRRLGEVRAWIEALREVLPAPGHPFFL